MKPIIKPMSVQQYQGDIVIEGHIGTWYVLSQGFCKGERAYLLEHEEWGDEAASLIVNQYGTILLDQVYDGWKDERMSVSSFR